MTTATWSNISNAQVAVGGIPSSSTVTALRDNPVALVQAASGAPVNEGAWHPWDKLTVGDGKTGVIYDYAVNGGASEVITPDFENGYEYRLVGDNFSHNSGSSQYLIVTSVSDSGASGASFSTTAYASNYKWAFDLEMAFCRNPNVALFIKGPYLVYSGGGKSGVVVAGTAGSPNIVTKRAKIGFNGGSIDSGKLALFRRRDYGSVG